MFEILFLLLYVSMIVFAIWIVLQIVHALQSIAASLKEIAKKMDR